jgi:nucleotidyltransferase/DNA polymerase involved in DNA repair
MTNTFKFSGAVALFLAVLAGSPALAAARRWRRMFGATTTSSRQRPKPSASKWVHLCRESFRKAGVVVRSSNYTLYGDMSARVMRVLSNFTPNLEIYSG